MTGINKNSQDQQAGQFQEATSRLESLDGGLVEYYLACSRKTAQVTIDSTHLAQLCNEVWRRRRADTEQALARALGADRMAERAKRLGIEATRTLADVGHTRPFEGRQVEAAAIVQVANLLAELMDWRGGKRRPLNEQTRDLGGPTVYGSAEAIGVLNKLLDELESAQRIITELERMGWLMKQAKP
jgi:hypothetical protein